MYTAIICRLKNVRKHSNADRLQIALTQGNQVVVGMDAYEDQLGIYFPTDGQLSDLFCEKNNLYRHQGGYFDKTNSGKRVRTQPFRGEKSEGFFCPIEYLSFLGDISSLKEGDLVTEFGGQEICSKYYTPATIKAMRQGNNKPSQRKQNICFAKHVDTTQFRFVDRLPKNSLIYFTLKMHGTSQRIGNVQEVVGYDKSFLDKLLRKQGKPRASYVNLRGTRNVVMGDNHSGFYGSEEFRYQATKSLEGNLRKGEVIYGELVGYTTTGQPIMGEVNTEVLKDKEFTKKYGKRITYTYGCEPYECKFYIYRITHVNEDGYAIDLPWAQVKTRCSELGFNSVPELGTLNPYLVAEGDTDEIKGLSEYVNTLTAGPDPIDPRHIREGVVLRVESGEEVKFIKSKSFEFYVLEGVMKSDPNNIDVEEAF